MIKSLYNKYFQKSKIFLFPLFELPKCKVTNEVETYLVFDNIVRLEDFKIICIFKNINTPEFIKFEKEHLVHCPHILEKYDSENQILYVFSLESFKEEYRNFLKGRYSKMSEGSKYLIRNYYKSNSNEFSYIETYLYPSKYYEVYAKLLDVDINLLKDVSELCDRYDEEKEILKEYKINLEVLY